MCSDGDRRRRRSAPSPRRCRGRRAPRAPGRPSDCRAACTSTGSCAEEPARRVVVVRGHVDAGSRRPGRGSSGSGVRTSRATPTTSSGRPIAPASTQRAAPRATARRSGGGSRPARPSRPRAAAARTASCPASDRRARLLEEQVLPGLEHRARPLGVVDRARGEDDRVDVVRGEELLVGATRARRARAPPPPPAPAGSRRPRRAARRRARARFAHGPSPIPPSPATPSLHALTQRDATMTASQSLAQPFAERSDGRRSPTSREDAGVSSSTASRALNGRGELSERTRAAVRRGRATRSSSSRRSSPARCARRRPTRSASSSPTSRARSTPRRSRAPRRRSSDAGYRVMLMDCEQSAEREVAALRTLIAHRVDGLLVSTVGHRPRAVRRRSSAGGVPCVFFDSSIAGAGDGRRRPRQRRTGSSCSSTTSSSTATARIGAARRLADRDERHRAARGLRGAMERHAPASDAAAIAAASAGRARTARGDARAARAPSAADRDRRLERRARARRAARAAASAASRIPDDLALATFDDAYFAELLDPPLTAVAYDPAEVGHAGGRAARRGDRRRGEPQRRDVSVPGASRHAPARAGARRDRDTGLRSASSASRSGTAASSRCGRPISRSPRASSSACSGRRAAARRRR